MKMMMTDIDWTAVGALGVLILIGVMCIIAVAVDR